MDALKAHPRPPLGYRTGLTAIVGVTAYRPVGPRLNTVAWQQAAVTPRRAALDGPSCVTSAEPVQREQESLAAPRKSGRPG